MAQTARKLGFDQKVFQRVQVLDATLLDATSAQSVASATVDALTTRLTTFDAALELAKSDRSIAKQNLSSAKTVESSIIGAMRAALQSAAQALQIFVETGKTLETVYLAGEKAVAAGELMSALGQRVTAAEAKNSYMTPQLAAAAASAESAATAVVAAAATTVQEAIAAFAAAEQVVWASFLVVAELEDFRRLVGGYFEFQDSDNKMAIPDALIDVPRVPDLQSLLGFSTARGKKTGAELIPTVIYDWLFWTILRRPPPLPPGYPARTHWTRPPQPLPQPNGNDKSAEQVFGNWPQEVSLSALVRLATAPPIFKDGRTCFDYDQLTSSKVPAGNPASDDAKNGFVEGIEALLHAWSELCVQTETQWQDRATKAAQNLTIAQQDLARAQAALTVAQQAVSAAQVAVGR